MSDNTRSPGPRIFSGVQPTGQLHLGNYLGALKQFVRLQNEMNAIYCIVDLHALTLAHNPEELRGAVNEVAAAYLAAGIDPARAIIFSQSQVPGHAELAWMFMCIARMGWLSRMTQFKDKAGKDKENASVGLFAYPALMAADILLYRATHVPVGDDQKQHLELTRNIAQKFNHDFQARIRQLGLGAPTPAGEEAADGQDNLIYFPLTNPVVTDSARRIMSLRDGTKKMSKAEPSPMSRISLTDTADEIVQKIRKARTDPQPLPTEIEGLAGRAEADNLVGIYAALAGLTKAQTLRDFGGAPFSRFKPALAELIVEEITPIGTKMRALMADTAHLEGVLKAGAARASDIAGPTLRDVRAILGLC